jgi:hypothetical protein
MSVVTVRQRRLVVAALVSCAVLGSAGCGSSDDTAASAGAVQLASAPTPAALVKQVALNTDDFPPRTKVKLYDAGDQVAGQVTLDFCGFDFTSEANRLARRQVAVLFPKAGKVSYSNEVVAYDTDAHAAAALQELRTSVATCPPYRFMGSAVKGVPAIRTAAHQVTDKNLRVADNTVVTATLTARGAHRNRNVRMVLYFQRQGAILSAIYFATPGKPSKEQKDMARYMAQTTGFRLAAT